MIKNSLSNVENKIFSNYWLNWNLNQQKRSIKSNESYSMVMQDLAVKQSDNCFLASVIERAYCKLPLCKNPKKLKT
jgi:hypothetical protein